MSDELNAELPEGENVQASFPDSFDYAQESDAPQPKEFAITKKGGYAEEEVDVWVNEVLTNFSDVLNRYNQVVHSYLLLKQEYDRVLFASQNPEASEATIDERTQAALVAQHAQLEQMFQESYTSLQAQYQEREDAIIAYYQGQQVETAATTEAVEPVEAISEHQIVSARAQQILDEASRQATAHVEETHSTMERLLREAEAEATETVETARAEAEELVTTARAEANEAIEVKNAAVSERQEIFERLRMFYAAQLEGIAVEEGQIGFSPLLTADSDLGLDEVVEEEPVDEVMLEAVENEVSEMNSYETVEYDQVEEAEGTADTADTADTEESDEEATFDEVEHYEDVVVDVEDTEVVLTDAERELYEVASEPAVVSSEPVSEEYNAYQDETDSLEEIEIHVEPEQ